MHIRDVFGLVNYVMLMLSRQNNELRNLHGHGPSEHLWITGVWKLFLTLIVSFCRVPLANGGSLVIEQTEALVSIDVNGGHGMLGQENSQEEAILEVNLAAAKQVCQNLNFQYHVANFCRDASI